MANLAIDCAHRSDEQSRTCHRYSIQNRSSCAQSDPGDAASLGNVGNHFEPTKLSDMPAKVCIMNDQPFRQVAYAFSGSNRTATRLGLEVETGMLGINHHGLALLETAFGGIKDSGDGTEGGSTAIEAYLETRFISRS